MFRSHPFSRRYLQEFLLTLSGIVLVTFCSCSPSPTEESQTVSKPIYIEEESAVSNIVPPEQNIIATPATEPVPVVSPSPSPSPLAEMEAPALDDEHAKSLIKKSDDLMRGDSNSGIYTMKIVTPRWERELKLDVYSLGRDKVFIRILSPEKEAGIGTLRIGNEMWNYLPRVEKTIKIPPSLMLQPWMGSDFANDDLVKESSIVHDYYHRIVAEEIIDGHPAYKIEMNPKPTAPVIWGKMYRWIRMDDAVPLREEYYDEHEKLIKVLEYSDIAQVSDRVIPRVWTMTSHIKPGHSTVITLVDVQYNQPINENVFTISNLKKAR